MCILNKRSESYTGNRGGECSPIERLAHCLRVDFTCPYCLCDLRQAPSIHMDHVTAQVWGGQKSARNIVACCGRCNCSKQHKPLRSFAAERGDANMVQRVRRYQRRSFGHYLARAKIHSREVAAVARHLWEKLLRRAWKPLRSVLRQGQRVEVAS